MARFLFASIPFTGHINPGLPIASELVRQGHDVRWYTTPRFKNAVEKVGARYIPYDRATPFDEEHLNEQLPERADLKGLNQLRFDLNRIFIDPVPSQITDLEAELDREPADVVIGDSASGAAGIIAEIRRLPWAVYGISVLSLSSKDTPPFGLGLFPNASPFGKLRDRLLYWMVENVIFKDPLQNFKRVRKELALPEARHTLFDFALDASLYLQACVPSFEYPRTDLPDHVRYIGAFVPEPPANWVPPAWWGDLDKGKKVVLVTQGTIANDYDELIRPAIRALAQEDVLVVVTTGSKPPSAVGMDPLPPNVRVEQFIPYAFLMPKVDLFLTNGGYGSVQIALANGVPIVTFGASEDKPEIANRVTWSGVGLGIKSKRPTEPQIREAVRKALANEIFHNRAQALQREMTEYDPARISTELLEDLIPKPKKTLLA